MQQTLLFLVTFIPITTQPTPQLFEKKNINMNSLKITNLTKTYDNGVKALSNIYLEIENGMFGLLGPNGAGKSTLMKTIVGLQQPDSGGIFQQGKCN